MTDKSRTCFTPAMPAIRTRAYPDLATIPQPAGTSSFSMIAFDIDAQGKPTNVRVEASGGNAALDAAAIRATANSRFAPGGRTGCRFPYFQRHSDPILPPPPPAAADFRKPDARCETLAPWTLPPRMTFPEPFARRVIEGWAIIGYDVAPWGATGNVTVLASEPAAAFGEEAKRIVAVSKRPPSAQGASGCVERVMFKLPGGPPPPQSDAPPPF